MKNYVSSPDGFTRTLVYQMNYNFESEIPVIFWCIVLQVFEGQVKIYLKILDFSDSINLYSMFTRVLVKPSSD